MRGSTFTLVLIAAMTSSMIGQAHASRGGAVPGVTGGPANSPALSFNGQTCTACHAPLNLGIGSVTLLDVPQRYELSRIYDIRVHIFDPEREGAGFQISVENPAGHVGTLIDADGNAGVTKFAGGSPFYITHTGSTACTALGYGDSRANWAANGFSYDYPVRWQAPSTDVGPITFYVSANATTCPNGFTTAHYYATQVTIDSLTPADADGDTDVDVADYAALQRCFSQDVTGLISGCVFTDSFRDNAISQTDLAAYFNAVSGPTSQLPAGFVLADAIRGGKVYDKWWIMSDASAPGPTDHPLYPSTGDRAGTGGNTYRCKECHGWDYKGVDGAYGDISTTHATGIRGVFGTTLGPQAIFDLLMSSDTASNGHSMATFGMTESDAWDVVKMVLEKTIDTDKYILPLGSPGAKIIIGNGTLGSIRYDQVCVSCHAQDGSGNFGGSGIHEHIGTLAGSNPWEYFHKARFGHPGAPMPILERIDPDLQTIADIGRFLQTQAP